MSESFKELKEQLLLRKQNGFDVLSEEDLSGMEEYCADYMTYLDQGKTERACVKISEEMAKRAGFRKFEEGDEVHAGDKFYFINAKKSMILAYIGTAPLSEGIQIAGAHIDSPRLDLKPNPLYEDKELAYLKTHYYGGIRKYQWLSIPLELHGVVVLSDGKEIEIHVGDEPGDPRFVINDLLPHLGHEQETKPMAKAVDAENLNVLIGSEPIGDTKDSDRIKLGILKILHEKYKMTEADFQTAELEVIPAGSAYEIGFDRSLIGAYGQDDRSCAYAALRALLDLEEIPTKTAMCILADKEEIGSDGVTGMQSAFFDMAVEALCDAAGVKDRVCKANSFCLSADVTAAYDPNYGEVYEKMNAAYLNHGIAICKYTGSRGKSGASDASAETVGYVRSLFEKANVLWQIDELGRVDVGGGGTIAKFMANRNIPTIDAGVPLLAMHAPFEISSKIDCYETYLAMKAVYQAEK